MLSFRNSNLITAAGMHCFAHLVNLKHLDLECCPHIHGGLVHIKGLTNLEKLNVGWCISIKNSDVKNLTGKLISRHPDACNSSNGEEVERFLKQRNNHWVVVAIQSFAYLGLWLRYSKCFVLLQ
jgi:hypothetical protein